MNADPSAARCSMALIVNGSKHVCTKAPDHEPPHMNEWITWTSPGGATWRPGLLDGRDEQGLISGTRQTKETS